MPSQRTANDVIIAGKAVSQVWGRLDEKIRYRRLPVHTKTPS